MRKLIIIEDNEKNLKLFKDILSTMPQIEIQSAVDGEKGLELIKSNNPDLIVLDIQLPGMSGIEICKELRTIDSFKDTYIIALTSFAMKGDKERILSAGFNEYISKPIRVANFRKSINSAIESL